MDDGLGGGADVTTNTRRPLGWRPGQAGRVRVEWGATIAAVVCQLGPAISAGPHICGQGAVYPGHRLGGDVPFARRGANAEGHGLTTALVRWFADHYVDPADRDDPGAPVARADNWLVCQPQWVSPVSSDPAR